MWECDGCQGVFPSEEEGERHILEQGIPEDLSTIQCWGLMEVGGPAWTSYHVDGRHPMVDIICEVELQLMISGT